MDNLTKYRLAELESADPRRAKYLRSIMEPQAQDAEPPTKAKVEKAQKATASNGDVETPEG